MSARGDHRLRAGACHKKHLTRFHQFLDGAAGVEGPIEWEIGLLCEGFGCLPSAVIAEQKRVPAGLLEDILTYRAYARAKARYEHAERTKTLDQLGDDEMTQQVLGNVIAIVKAAHGGGSKTP